MPDPLDGLVESDPLNGLVDHPPQEEGWTDKLKKAGAGWLKRKVEEQKAKQAMPFGKRLLTELGNAPLPAGDMGLSWAINQVLGDGKPTKAKLGILSPNAPTAARIVKGGVLDPALGAGQMATRIMGEGRQTVDSATNAVHDYYKENFDESPAGEGAGGMLVGGAGAVDKATKISGAARRLLEVAKAAGKGGAIAPLMTPEANIQNEDDYWARKKSEASLGVALGGSAGVIADVAAANPLARLLGDRKARQEAVDYAERLRTDTASKQFPGGAEPSLGEAMRNPTVQALENLSEYVPLSGRKAQLEGQNRALAAKLKELVDQRRAAAGPGGAGATISESAKRKLAENKATYGKPFDEIRDAVDASGVRVSPKNAIQEAYAAKHELEQYSGNRGVLDELDRLITDLESGQYGNTLGKLQREQDQIQARTRDLLNSGSPDSVLASQNMRVSRGFGKDIEASLNAADPSGSLSARNGAANLAYAENVHAYNPAQPAGWEGYRPEARILHGKELFSDKVADRLLQGDNAQMAAYARRGLDQAGQEAVPSAIMQRVENASVGEGGLLSAKKAANEIKKHENFIREFFPNADQTELEGFRNALVAMERSGQYLEKLQTGKFLGAISPFVRGVAATATGAAAPASTGATLGMVRLYTKLSGSKAGKEWLLAASRMKPNSKEMQEMLKRLPVAAGIGASDLEEK